MSRIRTLIATLIGVVVVAGGATVAVAANGTNEPTPPRTPLVNAPGVITQAGYVPLAPCRILDTRKAVGTIKSRATRRVYVAGTTHFSTQGGTSTGCKVPVGASAAALSVTTTRSTGSGYLTLFGDGSVRPQANQTSLAKGQTLTTLVNAPLSLTNGKVEVYSSTTTHVVIDVAGYYREPIAVAVNYDGSVASKSNQVVSVTHTTTGYYVVTFSQSVAGCVPVATANTSAYNISAYTDGSTVTLFDRDVVSSGTPYVDSAFTLVVTC